MSARRLALECLRTVVIVAVVAQVLALFPPGLLALVLVVAAAGMRAR